MKKLITLISLGAGFCYAQANTINSNVLVANGLLTIPAKSHTLEQNMRHEAYCNSIGGVDITDNSAITVGKDTMDAVFCEITDQNKYKNTLSNISGAGILDSNNELILSSTQISEPEIISYFDNNANGPTVSAQAANGTVAMGAPWYVRGAGTFTNVVRSNINLTINVPDFLCSATNQTSNFTGSSSRTVAVTCNASQGRSSTVDYVTATINGAGAEASGTIFFR